MSEYSVHSEDQCISYDSTPTVTVYIVAVYLTDIRFGGREEGGWYYDTGSLARQVRQYRSQEAAYAYARRLNEHLRSRSIGPNRGRREKSSVLGTGEYAAIVFENLCPAYYPESRPRYE